MNFVTHNSDEINVNGSHLQGYVDAKYSELVSLFGKPHDSDGYKVDAEWNVQFADGTVATIYNYKNGRNYCGSSGSPKEAISNWHIGGFTKQAVDNVQITIDLFREQAAPKPKTKADEAFGTAMDMMNMIRKTKGKDYADLVEIIMLARKQGDLLFGVTAGLVQAELIPVEGADVISKINAQMLSKIITKFMRLAKLDDDDVYEEAIKWADRLMEYEAKGAEEIIKAYKRKHKEADE